MKFKLAKGVADFVPEEKLIKNKLVATLQSTFEKYGFTPLETPIIERFDTLAVKSGAGTQSDALKEVFKLTDQGGRSLGLRFELTTSLARFVAMNPTLKMPFKRYEIGSVFRDGPIKLGRSRQFTQCDIDIIGVSGMLAEAELVAVARDVFVELGLDVVIKVNNRKILNGLLEQVGIEDKENVLVALDKLEKIGQKGVAKELLERNISQDNIDALFSLIDKNTTLAQLKERLVNEEAQAGIVETEELFYYIKTLGIKNAVYDLSLVRGLSYYTGPIFEVFLKQGKVTSSLLGGGRYDNLIGEFFEKNRVVPAVGISFGIVPIMVELLEKEKLLQKTPAQIYVIPIKTQEKSLQIAQILRKANLNVSLDLTGKGVSKNLDYASKLGIPYVVIVGENELKENKVVLRDMVNGEELRLTVKEVIDKLQ